MLALTFAQNVTGNVVMRANVSVLSTAGSSLWCNVLMCGSCVRIRICLYVCVPRGMRICERLSSTPHTNTQRTFTDSNPVQSLYAAAIISMAPKRGHLLPRIHTRTVCATNYKPMAARGCIIAQMAVLV